MSEVQYLAKGIEISTSMDEFSMEDSFDLAETILTVKDEDKKRLWCFITAGNVDWRGSAGVALFELDISDKEVFWQRIAGINGDWTLSIDSILLKPEYPTAFDAMVYSHDTPTGGFRRVKFYTSTELLNDVLTDSTEALKQAYGCATYAQLIKKIDNTITAEDLMEYL